MNGINSKDRFSFAKGYRARTIFLIFDILLLGILMCMMVLPLLKVIVDSIDPPVTACACGPARSIFRLMR